MLMTGLFIRCGICCSIVAATGTQYLGLGLQCADAGCTAAASQCDRPGLAATSQRDSPTLGRPMMATARGPSCSSTACSDLGAGSDASSASSMSPVPVPLMADTGKGSMPVSQNSAACAAQRRQTAVRHITWYTPAGAPYAGIAAADARAMQLSTHQSTACHAMPSADARSCLQA